MFFKLQIDATHTPGVTNGVFPKRVVVRCQIPELTMNIVIKACLKKSFFLLCGLRCLVWDDLEITEISSENHAKTTYILSTLKSSRLRFACKDYISTFCNLVLCDGSYSGLFHHLAFRFVPPIFLHLLISYARKLLLKGDDRRESFWTQLNSQRVARNVTLIRNHFKPMDSSRAELQKCKMI